MVTQEPIAAAKSLLRNAARVLGTAPPPEDPTVSAVLDEALHQPPARSSGDPLRLAFSEGLPGRLSLLANPGSPADRASIATQAMEEMTGRNFGSQALGWFQAQSRGAGPEAAELGSFGTSFDRGGPTEAMVAYRWGPGTLEALPAGLYELALTAMQALPGLRPAISTIRVGRTSGSQQMSFEVSGPLPLSDLKPLMERLGLEKQHASLTSAVAFILGARFTLPPDAAMITVRPTRVGVELRLDVNLELIPDLPPQLLGLLQLQLAERPLSLRALDRWLAALTPDGYDGPGSFSVLSVLVRPDLPARVALYLRPSVLEQPGLEQTPTADGGVLVVPTAPAPVGVPES
jgi:hypothetical protein